ncbi:hypothetical protein IscW_ISCW016980 [Ixodes scapularis]|uniref:Uncharacterized protein n=1 Tax=Ixodes scapularis TaxID=6945 RepID=B7P810_IXOSC|nr:hypothetical protein IscW_ISCW016980 [Ixodes scapularis]|eukprot:XP_002400479.1 hypothetical protein IscW_ISCW016980 [Ixodes scapularis]
MSFSFPQPRFVQPTLEDTSSVVKLAVRRSTGQVCGFGVIQEELRGRSALLLHIHAENYHVANLLVKSKGVQLTVPVVQEQTWTLLSEFGLSRSGHSLSAHVCFSLREIEFDHRRMYIF